MESYILTKICIITMVGDLTKGVRDMYSIATQQVRQIKRHKEK